MKNWTSNLQTHYAGCWRGREHGACAVSGIRFVITDEPHHPFQPSVDRIDGRLGYIVGNVRFVCLAVNVAMNRWGQDNLLKIAKGMVLRDLQRQLDQPSGS